MTGALEGVRVIEVADYITGPYTGMLLADLGAEVIKIERGPMGDPFRGFVPGGEGYDTNFLALNRNKKSVTLNLANEGGQQIFRQLAETASVIIENHRPGLMKRWGLDFDTLRATNTGLIYCSISGFGQDGPYRDYPGYDSLGVAMGGLLSLLTNMEAPEPLGITFADHLTGIFAAYGILAALHARTATGLGQRVETSLLQSIVSFVQGSAAQYLATGIVPREPSRANLAAAFVAGDGKPFVFHLSTPPKFWEGLTEAVGRPELRDDLRFTTRQERVKNYRALHDVFQEIFSTAPREEWITRLRSYDVPVGPLYDLEEVFNDPQVRHLGMPVELKHPKKGPVRLSGNPVNLEGTPIRYESAPPLVGEHTTEVLGSIGYGAKDVERLTQDGIL